MATTSRAIRTYGLYVRPDPPGSRLAVDPYPLASWTPAFATYRGYLWDAVAVGLGSLALAVEARRRRRQTRRGPGGVTGRAGARVCVAGSPTHFETRAGAGW